LLLFYGCWLLAISFGSFKFNQHNHFSLPTVLNTLAHTLASLIIAFGNPVHTPKPLEGVIAHQLWLLLALALTLARFYLISTFIFRGILSSILLLTLLLLFYGCWQPRAHPDTPGRGLRASALVAVGSF
jgi:hypothetical protein